MHAHVQNSKKCRLEVDIVGLPYTHVIEAGNESWARRGERGPGGTLNTNIWVEKAGLT